MPGRIIFKLPTGTPQLVSHRGHTSCSVRSKMVTVSYHFIIVLVNAS